MPHPASACDEVRPGKAAGLDRWACHEYTASKKVGNNSLEGCHTIACSFVTYKVKECLSHLIIMTTYVDLPDLLPT